MKGIVYDTETGEILRQMSGAVPIENQRLEDSEEILTDEDVTFPESLNGEMVDVESETIVDDPEYEPPKSQKEVIKEKLENEEISEREALMELLNS